jgi:hypothetical protein
MTCSCLAGFCPLCAGVTYRAPLAHRSGLQQRRPVRSDLASRLETKGEGTDQEPDAVRDLRVNVIGHDAPIIGQEHRTCPAHERSTP